VLTGFGGFNSIYFSRHRLDSNLIMTGVGTGIVSNNFSLVYNSGSCTNNATTPKSPASAGTDYTYLA